MLEVETVPAGAVVFLDRQEVGPAPLALEVSAGTYEVEARAEGFEPAFLTVEAVAGDTTVARLTLRREGGTVAVVGLPAGARVRVNGREAGAIAAAEAGFASVRVSAPGVVSVSTVVPVAPGAETEVAYREPSFRGQYVLYAALLPGGLQLLDGRPAAGALFAGSLFAAGLGAVASHQQAALAEGERVAALVDYESAITEFDAVEARARASDAAARGRRALWFRGAFAATAVLVELAAIRDGVLHHARRPSLDVSGPSLGVGPGGISLRLGL